MEAGKRVEKGKGELDLDICPGFPEFLVMRLALCPVLVMFGAYS